MNYICPVCKGWLQQKNKSFVCNNGHVFDVSKEGYVNLILANEKNSRLPGDNQIMVAARRKFLNKNHYLPLAMKIEEIISCNFKDSISILDAGAGTGYYLKTIAAQREDKGYFDNFYGIDISKFAAKAAAKELNLNCRQIQNSTLGGKLEYSVAVASVFNMPFESESFDVIYCVFSPFAANEYKRVLKKDGIIIAVTPAENHLHEMRTFLYDSIRANETILDFDGFKLESKTELNFKLNLESKEDIAALLEMTPYLYRTERAAIDKLLKLDSFRTTADFNLWVIKK